MKRISIISAIILSVCCLSTTLYAQPPNNKITLGNIPVDGQLKIEVFGAGNSAGSLNVTRYSSDRAGTTADPFWVRQFYDDVTTPLFSIKIGNQIYASSGKTAKSAALLNNQTQSLVGFDVIEDIGTAVTVGTLHEMTKRFTALYAGNTFSVTITITYNTKTPEYFVKDAIIDATYIPPGTPIVFAYGFDTFLANDDAGFAFIIPDIFGLNDTPVRKTARYLTTAQVQSLRLVGAKNAKSGKIEHSVVKQGQLEHYLKEAHSRGFELPLTKALFDFLKDSPYTIKDANRMSPSFLNELMKYKL